MGISGVGSVYSYSYNLQTKRLSAGSGQGDDEFAKYYNDDLKGEETDSLNGYDRRTKGVIKNAIDRIQEFYEAGLMDKPIAEEGTSDITVSCEVENSMTTSVSVNGEKRLTMVSSLYYLPDEIMSFSTVAPSFKTREHQDYNPADNSIHIAVGDKFTYGNGYTFTVCENKVMGAGYDGKSDAENQAADKFLGALDSFLHFADQQYFSAMIDKEMTPQILNFLQNQGVDTNREFIVNGTHCEVKDGRICEVGNKTGVPNTIYNKALARYEESLGMSLKTSSYSKIKSVGEGGEPYGRSRVEMLVKQYGEESPYSKALRALEKSFDATFSNIPDQVKDDWIEMCIDSGVNQITGISLDGKESHISQIMMQKAVNDYNISQGNYQYVDFGWGKSVESLMGIVSKGIYDIDNPLPGQLERSDSVKKLVENERNFYVSFLEKWNGMHKRHTKRLMSKNY